jgi:hypothetical protein
MLTLAQMCRRFIAAAGQVKPSDMPIIKNAKAVHSLWRNIHPAIGRSRRDKEHLLRLDKASQGAIQS